MPVFDWIPVSKIPKGECAKHDKLSATLEMKHISTKQDNFGRDVVYLKLLNPDSLKCIKEFADKQGIDLSTHNLPFWFNKESEECIWKVLKKNCNLTEAELAADMLTCEGEFRLYDNKRLRGFSLYIS